MSRGVVLLLTSALGSLIPATAHSQRGPRIVVGAEAAITRLERSGPERALEGLVTGANGRFAYRAVALEVAYTQGTLTEDGDATVAEDLIDGEAMLALRVQPWLVIRSGPHLRAFVTPAGTERWSRWELRMLLEADLVPAALRADVELATSIAADVNTVEAAGSAHGASVGATLHIANSPIDLRLAYATDRATTGASGGAEFLQSVSLRVTIGRR